MWPAILAENSCKGLAKLGNLVLAKWSRGKERRDALMQAQTRKDVQAIEAGKLVFTGEELRPALELPNMPPAAVPLVAGMEDEAHNLNTNLAIAANILKDTPDDQVSDEPVNPDWFARWRREAQVIGDEEMRQLWGRILAEEVKNPHAISLTTLDILKNITAEDAELFCKVSRFRINGLIPIDPAPLGDYNANDLLNLQDLNLINVNLDVKEGSIALDDCRLFRCNGFVLSAAGCIKFSLTDLRGATLTRAGQEIYSISDAISPATEEEIKKIGDAVWANHPSQIRAMSAHPIIGIRLLQFQYDSNIILHSWGE